MTNESYLKFPKQFQNNFLSKAKVSIIGNINIYLIIFKQLI